MPTNKNVLAGAALLVGTTLLRIKGRAAWLLRLTGLGAIGAGLAAKRPSAGAPAAATPPRPPEPVRAAGPAPAAADDALVAEEEAAASAEAAAIGGPHLDDAHGDPAMEAVYEAGGGEAEGFEAAENALIENATHGDGRGDPARDAMTPEVESDLRTGVDAEADEILEADEAVRDARESSS